MLLRALILVVLTALAKRHTRHAFAVEREEKEPG
jgi:hypothetical protein